MTKNECYTPAPVIEAARKLLGTIALDPASCAEANETVKAIKIFTKEDDGLHRAWEASTVWCNPPYSGKGNPCKTAEWWAHMLDQWDSGHFREGLFLMNASPSARWVHEMGVYDFPVLFTDGRLAFEGPGGGGQPRYDNMIVYITPAWHSERLAAWRFQRAFKDIGRVLWTGGF